MIHATSIIDARESKTDGSLITSLFTELEMTSKMTAGIFVPIFEMNVEYHLGSSFLAATADSHSISPFYQ